MSLWFCPVHGLVNNQCCDKCSLAEISSADVDESIESYNKKHKHGADSNGFNK